jgi:putative SOS response-associated peptidase YedK
MCGRFTLTNPERLPKRFNLQQPELPLTPRFNVAPTQTLPVVLREGSEDNRLEWFKWGLIPFWSKEPKSGYSTINARAEGIADKPAYRKPIRSQRCLVPADGFYEWQKTGTGKQPFFIHLKNSDLFGFAGLYDIYRDKDGQELKTFTIITTTANDLVEPIHNRMPVILSPKDEAEWLDPTITDPFQVTRLLQPYPAELMELYPVSKKVNTVGNDIPELLETLNSA